MFQASLVLMALQVLSVAALPHPKKDAVAAASSAMAVASATASAVASSNATAGAGADAGEEEEEEKDENEVEQTGKFNTVITLGGGDVKTDTVFPAYNVQSLK
ncbi:hypothetical protein QBC32DRAFT_27388 [Pseudoneurospora amorphoporcata]|uniref:Uncharacterized protein n=1 Tax=Pseudoneurospora amorphoporcata TaxID=241081 RepID=A0AAN6NPX2_9PEZI|nr:hypothetical protein QBC32DRAFT_27388 [Pseudoneurospora amorphoporcata]